jgi:hypothetical protein
MYFDDGFIPEPNQIRNDDIIPLVGYIAKTMVALRNTLNTSTDIDEKIDTISKLALCQSSISLLSLAYLTEDYEHIQQAKHLYRGI